MEELRLNQMLIQNNSIRPQFMDMHEGAAISEVATNRLKDKSLANRLKRRSKKDKIGRNYKCGCGKLYLSYPALYTHIKTKHDGIHPEGTRTSNNTKTRRGRPKKHDYGMGDDMKAGGFDDERQIQMGNGTIHGMGSGFCLNGGSKMGEYSAPSDLVSTADLSILECFEENMEGSCNPLEYFKGITSQEEKGKSEHPFLQYFSKIQKGENLLSSPTCDTVFVVFLYNVSKIVSDRFYKLLAIFFKNLRRCLNETGYEVINTSRNQIYNKGNQSSANSLSDAELSEAQEKLYSEYETPEYLPLIADTFILEYLPKHCGAFDQSLAVYIIRDFCNWLFKKKLTKVKLEVNNNSEDDKEFGL